MSFPEPPARQEVLHSAGADDAPIDLYKMSDSDSLVGQNILYVGAGLDITPIVLFPKNNHYLMDSQPMSEFGNDIAPGYERPNFLARLDQVMSQIGLKKIGMETLETPLATASRKAPLKITYASDHQRVTYFANAVFPDALSLIPVPCSVLVVCGFSLTGRAPDFLAKWRHIICSSKTGYDGMSDEWGDTPISTIVWDDEVENEFLIENRTPEFIKRHTTIEHCW